MSTSCSMTIGGEAVTAAESFAVRNPATGEPFTVAPDCSRQQLDLAMAAASKAGAGWAADESLRRQALQKSAELLKGAADELAALLTSEQGKPLRDARREVLTAAHWLDYHAGLDLPVETIQDDETAHVQVVRRPLGVVAAITPWNYPLVLASWKLAPALLAGNTVVLKPSPFTPLTTLRMGELLSGAFPPGVINVVSGGDRLGAWMTGHPTPRKVSFTGSVATGQRVAAAAASDLKRVTLELGGNDAAIVLDDVDLERTLTGLFWGAFSNCGQVCSAIKRVYVPERLYDDFVDGLAAQARSVPVGDGMDPATLIGPVNNRSQLERVSGLVEDARRRGGAVVAGGPEADRPGYFFRPAVVAGLSEGVRLVDEEQFGPAVPVLSYRSVDEAVERANASPFGLSGSVWGTDTDHATSVAGRLQCGTVWINTHRVIGPGQPFGGHKTSGVGVENGPWGLAGFTELQVRYRTRP